MAVTVVLDAQDMSRIAVCKNKKELKEYEGNDFVFVTAKTFVASEQYPSWEELQGKEPKVESVVEKAPRTSLPEDGAYELVKELPAVAADHPKAAIWNAISENRTISSAKAACPETNPARKTKGTYSFTSEFRYFLRTGYVKLVGE